MLGPQLAWMLGRRGLPDTKKNSQGTNACFALSKNS